MSRDFSSIPSLGYRGVANANAIGLTVPSKLPPTSIDVVINWTDYGASSANPDVRVIVNLQGGAARQKLDFIKSVYIDNTNSNVPLYVRFPDSGFVATSAPNSADWYPVITNGLLVEIIVQGVATGQVPTSRVYFTNLFVPPYSDPELERVLAQWLASASITRGGNIFNTDYGIPALGDQSDTATLTLNGAGAIIQVFTPLPGPVNFIYLTNLSLAINRQNAVAATVVIVLRKHPIVASENLYAWQYFESATAIVDNFSFPPINCQLKLDGSLTYYFEQLQGGNTGSYANLNLTFSTNPA